MLRPQGYVTIVDPDSPLFECDTFTCAHCQRIVKVPPRAAASDCGGWCGRCAKPVCGPCADKGCTPWEKQMERMEARDRLLRSVGLVALLLATVLSWPALAQFRAGSTVRVPPATYGPTSAIACPAGSVNVTTSDNLQTLVTANGTNTAFCLAAGVHTQTSSVTPKSGDSFTGVYGAIIDATGWVSSDVDDAIFRSVNNGISDVTVRNLVLRNGPQYGVNAYLTATRWTVDHCEITGFRNGVSTGTYGVVTNNWVHHNIGIYNDPTAANRGGGYTFNSSIGTIVRNNDFSYNGQEQKFIYGTTNEPSQSYTISGNYVHHNRGAGLWIDGDGANSVMDNNVVDDNDGPGIVIEIATTVLVRSNTVRRSGEEGILISASRSTTVTGNTLDGNAFGIAYFLDFARLAETYAFWTVELTNNLVSANSVTVPSGSSKYGGRLTFFGAGDQTPYLNNTRNNNFQSNTYYAPNTTGTFFTWGTDKTFTQWQALPQDSLGTIQ